jgi:hypothetical protein
MHVHPPPQPERLVMRGGGGRSAKNVQPPRQNPRYAPVWRVAQQILIMATLADFLHIPLECGKCDSRCYPITPTYDYLCYHWKPDRAAIQLMGINLLRNTNSESDKILVGHECDYTNSEWSVREENKLDRGS